MAAVWGMASSELSAARGGAIATKISFAPAFAMTELKVSSHLDVGLDDRRQNAGADRHCFCPATPEVGR